MTEPEFNLLDEPWILVSNQNGEAQMLSITDVFARAHELYGLSGELPTQDTAILRLLLAILHSVFTYTDEKGEAIPEGGVYNFWQRLFLKGRFPMEAIERYLQQYHERFWLFHPERPFYQIANMEKGTPYGASKLIGELSESSNKLRLFQSRNGSAKEKLSFDEAARWLPYLISFDDTSSKPTRGEKLPSPGAGWLGKLGMVYALGSNFFETMMLNFILTNDEGERWKTGGAAWELDSPRTGERVEVALQFSQAALLTLQSRRVFLERKGKFVTGFRLLGGDFFQKENAFTEQMTVWQTSKDREDSYTPKRHKAERQMWRDFTPLLVKTDNIHTPGIVRWLGELQDENIIQPKQIRLRASAVQYGDKDFFVTDILDDVLSVNAALLSKLGEAWNIRISREVAIIDKVVSCLGYFASDLAEASGGSREGSAQRSNACEEAYFTLDIPFREWLANIDPDDENMDETIKAWREIVRNEILNLGKKLAADAGEKALVGRIAVINKREELLTAPKAYNKFKYLVRKILEEAEEG
ncbi:MAG: type I-E CRISPR-associated protein Cse1/CasA [Clostridiales bacterium]|jgi:CRISPR system Cascade subunit CasA|nr:type I-E CRISPR-associated protein Cse1/CasA [Clostridiales bacterium]